MKKCMPIFILFLLCIDGIMFTELIFEKSKNLILFDIVIFSICIFAAGFTSAKVIYYNK